MAGLRTEPSLRERLRCLSAIAIAAVSCRIGVCVFATMWLRSGVNPTLARRPCRRWSCHAQHTAWRQDHTAAPTRLCLVIAVHPHAVQLAHELL